MRSTYNQGLQTDFSAPTKIPCALGLWWGVAVKNGSSYAGLMGNTSNFVRLAAVYW